MNAILDAAIGFGQRYERAIAIIGGAWFVISCASWIPLLPVPEIPYLTDRNSWMFSGAWNGVWWGLVHPLLDKRRKQLTSQNAPPGERSGGD